MIVMTMKDVKKKNQIVKCPKRGFISNRYLIAKDGMGFGLHKTVIPKGTPQRWHYKNHLEACFCVSGHGILNDIKANEAHQILPGTMYALDKNDEHIFQAIETTILICVFNPPLKGDEVHDEAGSYSRK